MSRPKLLSKNWSPIPPHSGRISNPRFWSAGWNQFHPALPPLFLIRRPRMKPKTKMVILFLLPAGLLYFLLFLLPAVRAFYYSAFDWSGFSEAMTFVGFQNYIKLLTNDPIFIHSFGNTLKILFVGG